MNVNQSKNLTQKQKELIKRLESIRQNRESKNKEPVKDKTKKVPVGSQRRNESTRQNRPVPDNQFARPTPKPSANLKPKIEHKSKVVQPQKRVQRPKVATKKKRDENHYIKQLSIGKNLSQAIILSEILDKPVSMRKR